MSEDHENLVNQMLVTYPAKPRKNSEKRTLLLMGGLIPLQDHQKNNHCY